MPADPACGGLAEVRLDERDRAPGLNDPPAFEAYMPIAVLTPARS